MNTWFLTLYTRLSQDPDKLCT